MSKPDHSDFLIHWTGFDIDQDPLHVKLTSDGETTLNRKIIGPYLERLKFILRYGLWMTTGREYVEIREQRIKRPHFSRTSFTELKLSEAEEHAKRFGSLGIGFKRMFLFERMGSPMLYFRPEKVNWFISPYLKISEIEEYWACFLKSMHEGQVGAGKYVPYQQFEESEWRIIYSEKIKKELESNHPGYCEHFKDPNKIVDPEFQDFLSRQKKKPDFLIPLEDLGRHTSEWFSMIIYPSLAVKVAAEADPEIRQEIERLKPFLKQTCHVSTSATYEKYSKPLEIDLSACRNL